MTPETPEERQSESTRDGAFDTPRVRHSVQSWALTLLAILAALYSLHFAKDFLLPVVLALLLALLLSPVVQALHRLGLPHALGSALVVFGLAGLGVSAVSFLSAPAWEWIQQAPQVLQEARAKIAPLQQTVEEVNQAARRVEEIAQTSEVPVVRVERRSLREKVLDQASSAAVGAVMTVFLLYFLLASGGLLLRNLISALSTWSDKRRTMEIAHHLQREVSTYLFTFTLINATLAAVTGAALWLIGMPNPLLWGVMAGILNFVPYLGPATTLVVLSAVSVMSFDTPSQMVLPPAVFFVLTTLEGQLITPTILGQRLALNPIMIFLGLIFWGWLWGVVGALLAVPIMVTIKIVCDHVEPLKPVGVVMER